MNKKPNLFIVGAAKAGTTSLYYYLDQHRDIYMSPIKEPHYFSKDFRCKDFDPLFKSKRNCFDMKQYLSKPILEKKHIAHVDQYEDYLGLFRDVKEEKSIGEISNGYLYSKVAAKEIYQGNPNAKIIIILRDPISRAFSHWMMDMRDGRAKKDNFMDAVMSDFNSEKKGWMQSFLYIELGLYYEQVRRYMEVFPTENVKIMMYDDMVNDMKLFYEEILSFLELDTSQEIDFSKRLNVPSLGKYKIINKIKQNKVLRSAARSLPVFVKETLKQKLYTQDNLPKLTVDDRIQLIGFFENDIKNLEKLIDRDLSRWLH